MINSPIPESELVGIADIVTQTKNSKSKELGFRHLGPYRRMSGLGRFAVIIALLLTFIVLLPLDPWQPAYGLDASWAYALNEAVARHLVFGSDLTITFGPFGSVYTWLYHPATDIIMLVGSAILAVGLCSGFALLAIPQRPLILLLLPFVVVIAPSRDAVFMTLPLLLLLNVYQLEGDDQRINTSPGRTAFLALLACSIGILPLVKGSFSGVLGSLGALSVLVLIRARQNALMAALVLTTIVTTCIAWVWVGQPLLALPKFFIAQAPIISGYSEGMSLHGPVTTMLWWACAAFACIATFYFSSARRRGLAGFGAIIGLAAYFFVTFKAGFVRADHAAIAVGALLFVVLALATVLRPWAAAFLAFIVVVAWYGAQGRNAFIRYYVTYAYHRTISGIQKRIDNDALREAFQRANEVIRKKYPLGTVTGSVDVYPTELSMIFASGLKWAGRPVPQSYFAYTPGLDRLNAQHLLGPSAPDNIFFAVGPIDNRLAPLEDSESWPRLLNNYRIVRYEFGFIHLVKSASVAPPEVFPIGEVDANLNSSIDVPDATGPVIAAIEIRKTILGTLALTAFKLPRLLIESSLDSGQIVLNRYIAEMGRTGFVVSPHIGSTDDFIRIAVGDLTLKHVKSFRIIAPELGLWKKAIRVSFSTFKVSPHPAAVDMWIVKPQPFFEFVSDTKSLPAAQCSIEFVNGVSTFHHQGDLRVRAGYLSLAGWAAPSALNCIGPDAIWVVLSSADGPKRFYKVPIVPRADVSVAFDHPKIKVAGFDFTIDTSGLSGYQEVSIYTTTDGSAQECQNKASISLN